MIKRTFVYFTWFLKLKGCVLVMRLENKAAIITGGANGIG